MCGFAIEWRVDFKVNKCIGKEVAIHGKWPAKRELYANLFRHEISNEKVVQTSHVKDLPPMDYGVTLIQNHIARRHGDVCCCAVMTIDFERPATL